MKTKTADTIENQGRFSLSAKVHIANQLAKQAGGRPVLTMNELHAILAPMTAISIDGLRASIKEALGL